MQKKVENATGKKRRTIIPVIISSDKTQLTTFRNKTAYPVYLTLGNIPKHIRRKPNRQAQVLLAYLPTSKLDHITNQESRRRALANLFHSSMSIILRPLEDSGRDGIVLVSGDGTARMCHPIFAAFVGDYPEQLLVGIIKHGLCPVCPALKEGIGEPDTIDAPRDIRPILEALDQIELGPVEFTAACAAAGIKPVQNPFWKNLPFVNIYNSITPDILHQISQGAFKHLVGWVRTACGDAEIDARCRRLPPNHHIRLFMKGICHLSRVTGQEHEQIGRFLLGLVLDIRLPGGISNARLVRVVRALLDFMNLARYPVHTTTTLNDLDHALTEFHENKSIFLELGIRSDFDIPKLHNIGHYRHFIETYGTTDNTNTESTERLHIDMAKHAYAAGNKKDEYPQMTAWLDRREKIMHHAKFIRRRLAIADLDSTSLPPALPPPGLAKACSLVPPRRQYMAKHPTFPAVPLNVIHDQYGALYFEAALSRYIKRCQNPSPEVTQGQIEAMAETFTIPFTRIPVFHRLKFVSREISSLDPLEDIVVDSIHTDPARLDKYGAMVPGRFDTAVINYHEGGEVGVKGTLLACRFH